MNQILCKGIPFIFEIVIYEVKSLLDEGHSIGFTFFGIFILDIGIYRKTFSLTLGVHSLYTTVSLGLT